MEKKIKKLIKRLDNEFTDYGIKTVEGFTIEYSMFVDDGVRMYKYDFMSEGVILIGNCFSKDLYFIGKIDTFKSIYKTICHH